jgi:hypothetical protein
MLPAIPEGKERIGEILMADITMCANQQCPSRETCYRFTAPANELRQSMADFKPNESGKCEDYWNNGKGNKNEK